MMVNTEVLEHLRVANPAPSLEHLAENDLARVRAIVTHETVASVQPHEPDQPLLDRVTQRSRTRPVLAAGLAFILVLATLGVALLLLRGSDYVEPAGPQPAFDFSTDNPCDWLTAGEMNQIIATAQERAGTNWRFTPYEAGDCVRQEPYGSGAVTEWTFWLWATSRTGSPAAGLGITVGLVPRTWVPEIAGNWSAGEPAEEYVVHEMLDDSITYGALRYWSDWLENMSVDLRVAGHEDEVLRFTLRHSNPGDAAAVDAYEAQVALGFAIADAMLEDMGWVD